MDQVFEIQNPFRVPDGTLVAPFLNAKDSKSPLPFDLLDGFSLAAGEIEPHTESRIHILRHNTQLTFVLEGSLTVVMKDPDAAKEYDTQLTENQAVLTNPRTYLQLLNPGDRVCRVLYIVCPPYIYDTVEDDDGTEVVRYDDSIVLEMGWDDLKKANWAIAELEDDEHSARAREKATARIRERKQKLAHYAGPVAP